MISRVGPSVSAKMGLLNIVLVAALFATGFATAIKYAPCANSSDDICKVSEVRITPCDNPELCTLERRRNVTISFDFTPNFSTSDLQAGVFLVSTPDILFNGFGSRNGCEYTACPLEAGKQQTLEYTLYVNKLLPKGQFPIKWKLTNLKNTAQECCFTTNIKLKKK